MPFLKRYFQKISQSFVFCTLTCLSPVLLAEPASTKSPDETTSGIALEVLSSPTCGCCGKWVEHLQHNGFEATVHHPTDLNQEKMARGIAPRYQSCHTGVSEGGYVFEGHIPAHVIQRFLVEKPQGAIGLAVPGMPLGSPGMEMGDRFSPYEVLLLMADGSSSVYARIDTLAEQY